MMKKNIITAILLCMTTLSYAQTTVIDTVRYRFSYAMKGTSTETSKRQYDDELSVDIGDSLTYCYSRWDDDNDKLYKKIKANGGTSNDYMAQQGPVGLFDEWDIKHYPDRKSRSVITFLYKYFMYTEDIPDIKWQFEQGDTTILDYPCKKATCTFRRRTWNVWYTLDIPIQEGPWKLGGLPGMILYAKDAKNQFSFELIGIKANVNTPMEVELKRTLKSTPKQVQKLIMLNSSNYDAFDKAVGGTGIIYGFKHKPKVACLREYFY